MQTYNTALDFQTPMPQKMDHRPKADYTDKQNSFTEALDQELSQKQEPENGELHGKGETSLNSQEKPETEIPVIPLISGLMQNPYIQQALTGNQRANMPIDAGEVVAQQTANINQLTDGKAVSAFASQKAMAEQPQLKGIGDAVMREGSGQTNGSAAQTLKSDGEGLVHTEIQPAVKAGSEDESKKETDPFKSLLSNSSDQESMESLKDGKTAQVVQTGRNEAAVSREAAFQGAESVSKSTVDMTDAKIGLQKLSQTMADQMAKGKSEFEIWLEPANLGKLAIKVAYEGGKAMVSILCMNDKAMELISQNAKSLGTILEQHIGNNTVVVVEHPESDYLQQNSNQDNEKGYQQQEDASRQQDDQEAESQSFLQQLRLGLM